MSPPLGHALLAPIDKVDEGIGHSFFVWTPGSVVWVLGPTRTETNESLSAAEN